MRQEFANHLHKAMETNKDIFVLTGDLGWGILDKIQEDYPERFVNCGASEQAMLGLAVGLALSGKIPFVYTITPFLMRAMETINLYLHHEGVPVIMVGSGRDDDYKHDGYSHDASMFQKLISEMAIDHFYPDNEKAIGAMVKMLINNKKPSFISLRR